MLLEQFNPLRHGLSVSQMVCATEKNHRHKDGTDIRKRKTVYNLEIHRRSCTRKIFEENLFHNICQNSNLKKNPSTLYHVDKLISAG